MNKNRFDQIVNPILQQPGWHSPELLSDGQISIICDPNWDKHKPIKIDMNIFKEYNKNVIDRFHSPELQTDGNIRFIVNE